jgi:hypothetical protein
MTAYAWLVCVSGRIGEDRRGRVEHKAAEKTITGHHTSAYPPEFLDALNIGF